MGLEPSRFLITLHLIAMPTKVFWCENTGREIVRLRRYVSLDEGEKCPLKADQKYGGYHDAVSEVVDELNTEYEQRDHHRVNVTATNLEKSGKWDDDPRWPTHCACGYEFTDEDRKQVFTDTLYRRTDTGETAALRDMPAGAMWDAWWMSELFGKGDDGISLIVRLPDNHDWHVDGEASNCTRKGDKSHKCWVRHGDPRTGDIHVDKNGNTCQAGAGSIASGNYHGFLHHGVLTDG